MVLFASCASHSIRSSTANLIDQFFSDYNTPGSPGASVSIVRDGNALLSKAYGLADLEAPILATVRANYRLASLTKQFTAMAVMILADRGRLTLNDRLIDVLPLAPAYLQNVRIRHLLNHTSGIVDYEDLIPDSQTVQVLDRDVLTLLSGIDSVYFSPGERFKYSNSGYALLALVVEARSGQSFARFLRENIFLPLGMSHTVAFENGISTVQSRAYGYSRTDSGFVRTDQSVTSAVLGDGGIYASVDDLARWDQELYSQSLVPSSLFREAFSPAQLNDGSITNYGFGWYIEPLNGIRSVYHTGSTRGFRNAILRIPDKRLTIIILTNRNEGDPIVIARKIASLMLAQPS
jgi:CubicO group peptidase (beta-lactamase class C family)